MKQIKIVCSCPFFTNEKVFNNETEKDIKKQIKWITEKKKVFINTKYDAKAYQESPRLKVDFIHLNQPIQKPSSFAVPVKKSAAIISLLPVKAAPVKIAMENKTFIFHPKKRYFLAADFSASLTIKEARGLLEMDLLRVAKKDMPALKCLVGIS